MARKIKPPLGPFRTGSSAFDRGRDRPIEVTLFPTCLEIRAVGTQDKFLVTWGSILTLGASQAAAAPRQVRRGAVNGVAHV